MGDGYGEALKYDFVACKREYKLNEPWQLKYRKLTQLDGLQEYKYPLTYHTSGSTLGVRRNP